MLADVRDRRAEYRRDARRARRARFPRVLLEALALLAADGGVLAEPLPPRVALSPRARRRVPGHQPGAVGARLAAGRSRGARAPGWPRQAPCSPSIFIVGDRKQSIYGFRDADVSRARRGRHVTWRPAARRRRPPRDLAQLPLGAGAARVRQRRLRRHRARRARAATPSATAKHDRFPLDDGAPAAPMSARSAWSSGETPESCAAATAAEIARLLATAATVRDRDTGLRRPIAPATSPSCSARATATASSRARSSARGMPSTSTRASASSTPTRSRTCSRCCWYLAEPDSDLRAAALLRSRFVRLSDEALRRLAPRWRPRCSTPDPPQPAGSTPTTPRRSRWPARRSRAGGRWSIGCRRPSSSIACSTESAYCVEMRGPRRAAGAREPEEAARRSSGASRTAATRRSAASPSISTGWRSATSRTPSIDAHDAVNLMTVHAAKGLEFPVVFVVNLARGTGEPPRPDPRRRRTDARRRPSVAVGDFQSEADEDARREGTRGDQAPALCRDDARARPAVPGSVLKEGDCSPGRGSLGRGAAIPAPGRVLVGGRRAGRPRGGLVRRHAQAAWLVDSSAGAESSAEAAPARAARADR